ncbi:MAG: PEP-CTERM sorting domain-containing protein [Blastochloris sp.]|nr:PEP-CTERM sorting domain-containing protein [Blastochloris sp.]
MKKLLLYVTVLITTLALTPPASAATILVFQFANGDPLTQDAAVPQGYGDNVTANVTGLYNYGGAAPFTPNITVAYTTGGSGIFTATGTPPEYGGLGTVLYSSDPYTITFTADPGFLVKLESFNLAGFQTDETLTYSVSNGGTPFTVTGAAAPTALPNFVDLNLRAEATGQVVTLTFSSLNDLIGVTDISFSQIPEPSTYALLALGLGALVFLRRRSAA